MKPKTLGELFIEDVGEGNLSGIARIAIRSWLDARGITDATPLVVEEIGVVKNEEVTQDLVPIVRLYTDEGRGDITGRTVALLAKSVQVPGIAPESASGAETDDMCSICGGTKETHGHTPDGKTHWVKPCPLCCPNEPADK